MIVQTGRKMISYKQAKYFGWENILFNFSRNQLSYLPASVCSLINLQCLVANNNKLVSLPEEIGEMTNLMELDVSCNEIAHLPVQIGDLSNLRSLHLRRNHLQEVSQ